MFCKVCRLKLCGWCFKWIVPKPIPTFFFFFTQRQTFRQRLVACLEEVARNKEYISGFCFLLPSWHRQTDSCQEHTPETVKIIVFLVCFLVGGESQVSVEVSNVLSEQSILKIYPFFFVLFNPPLCPYTMEKGLEIKWAVKWDVPVSESQVFEVKGWVCY